MNKRQIKILLVLACAAFLILLLALLEPGYENICTYYGPPYYKYCSFHDVVYAVLWQVANDLNYFGPAIAGAGTLAIGIFTWTLWRSTDKAGKHYRVMERAYVKISHHTPKEDERRTAAFIWDNDAIGSESFSVDYQIKNHGKTPAWVTATCFTYEVLAPQEKLSNPPNYCKVIADDRTEEFLVSDDAFTLFGGDDIDATDKADVLSGAKTLLVFGYVDYVDQFGTKHRGGFGRQLDIRSADKNNLIFPDAYPGLNYDEEI